MTLLRLAVRNTRRQPRRSIMTAVAIAAAVALATFMDAYMTGAIEGFFQSFVRIEAGHVKVLPEMAVDRVRQLPLDDGLSNVDSLLAVIEAVDGVEQASPRIRFGVLLDGADGGVPAIGTALTPSRETELIDLDEWVKEGRVPKDGADETLIGRELAEFLGLTVGDELFFVASTSYGGLGPGVYTVTGIFESGVPMLDKKSFYVPLAPAQYQLAMENRAIEIAIVLADGMNASIDAAARIQKAIDNAGFNDVAAVPWQKQGYIYESMAPARFFEVIMMSLLAVIALTTVINTVLMSVMERVREIGALRALGFDRSTVTRMIVLESLLVGVVGTLIGLALGMTLSLWLQNTGLDFSQYLEGMDLPINPVFYPQANLATAIRAGLFGIVVAAIAAWYPARVAARLEPARALRSV